MDEAESNIVPVQIDIVSDVVCPWCIVGYKQLEQALENMAGTVTADIRWHPFELNPTMPPEGQDLRQHLAQKYGTSPAQSQAARSQLVALGEAVGFQFDYFDGMRMVNTFKAHQLLHWAAEKELQTPLKLALFEAFFSQRQDVSQSRVLVDVATDVGLPREEAEKILEDGRFAGLVRAEEEAWRDKEVLAVPTFVFNQRFSVPGAQQVETFVQLIEKLVAVEAS